VLLHCQFKSGGVESHAVIGLPLCSSFYVLLAGHLPGLRKARAHTGTGLRSAMVCLMKSCGLWRIAIIRVGCMAIIREGCMAIMRVGCMERARVALNMAAVLLCLQLGSRVESWRRCWGSKLLRGFRHRHADAAESSRSLPARKTPNELCVDKASRVE
jgi:hypothetical protein